MFSEAMATVITYKGILSRILYVTDRQQMNSNILEVNSNYQVNETSRAHAIKNRFIVSSFWNNLFLTRHAIFPPQRWGGKIAWRAKTAYAMKANVERTQKRIKVHKKCGKVYPINSANQNKLSNQNSRPEGSSGGCIQQFPTWRLNLPALTISMRQAQ